MFKQRTGVFDGARSQDLHITSQTCNPLGHAATSIWIRIGIGLTIATIAAAVPCRKQDGLKRRLIKYIGEQDIDWLAVRKTCLQVSNTCSPWCHTFWIVLNQRKLRSFFAQHIWHNTRLTYCTSQIGLNDLALQGSSTQWKSNDSQIAPQFESRPLFGWPEPQSVNSAVISSGYSFQISSRTSSVRPIQCLGAI